MPLDTNHLDEICEDIRMQYENGVTTCALFNMTLVPEGNPPVNKAKIMCESYDLFKQKLDSMGIPNGVLVQASIGHGWTLSQLFPFQRYVSFNSGKETFTVCPFDDGFCEYIYEALKTITEHNPCHIMIDDDFRLMARHGGNNGCCCPLHLKRFNELANTSFTREELLEILKGDSKEREEYEKIFIEIQKEAVVKAAKAMRAGMDSVNKKMPASFCCVSNNAEFASEIATILAGEGNPIVVRINNANYCSEGSHYLSGCFYGAATQIAKLKDKVDILLAETDTCPQNRYSKGAMSLHTHFTGSLLEGLKGAKQWITRLITFEPESGKAYRKILSKYERFYEELSKIVPKLKWRGCRIPVLAEPKFNIMKTNVESLPNAWAIHVLERLGLPMYFSAENGGVLCLEGRQDEMLTDSQLKEAFKGNVFLASDTAKALINRGFGEYIGVDVREWKGKQPSKEKLFVNSNTTNIQVNTQELVPLSENAVADSMVYHTIDNINIEDLFPGTVIFKNSLSGKVFTFCGTPRANYELSQAFAYLSYSRKQQLIKMLEQTGEMPLYYPGDEEVYLRAANMENGGLFAAIFNISTDPIEETELVIYQEVKEIKRLLCDGTYENIEFTNKGNHYSLKTPANVLDPVILIIN